MRARGRAAALLLAAGLSCAACAEPTSAPLPSVVASTVQDIAAYWERTLPEVMQDAPKVVIAAGDRSSGCGVAKEEEGSFFCAEDSTIYLQQLDLDDLADRPVATQEAARAYLLAHEYSHAVQVALGVDEGDAGPGPNGDSVRYELQADCLAGAYVASRDDAADLAPYVAAVREGGDDIGEDPLPPAKHEHGTAAQRTTAFQRGVRSGPQACDLPAA